MQLKTVASVKDIPFAGVEFVKTDKAITEVIIGGRLRIRKGESYNAALQVLIEQPFEEAKRFRVTATIDGFDPKISFHDDSFSAGIAGGEFEAKGATVAVEEIAVLVNDNGEVVGTVAEAPPANDGFDAPF